MDQEKYEHDLMNALNCIEFISDLLEQGYQFNDSKAPERIQLFRRAVALVTQEIENRVK